MEVLTREELLRDHQEIVEKIRKGAVFVYPTDTIYGLGCNALDDEAVRRIRKIKQRPGIPFSVCAPSKEWLKKNCELNSSAQRWLEKLPGPYTLIVRLKNRRAVSKEINPESSDTLGVRIPDCWFQEIVNQLNLPIVTTSVNVIGEAPMTSLEDLDPEIRKQVDFAVYEGEIRGKASKLVNLIGKEKITER